MRYSKKNETRAIIHIQLTLNERQFMLVITKNSEIFTEAFLEELVGDKRKHFNSLGTAFLELCLKDVKLYLPL